MAITVADKHKYSGLGAGIGHGPGAGRSIIDLLIELQGEFNNGASTVQVMAVYGAWAVDGDGVNTNGAGLVGTEPTSTEAVATYAKIEDATVFANLADSAGEAGYTAAYQLFPDAPVADADYAYFGHSIPFCEMGFDYATPAVYDSTAVTEWYYWDGSAWSALTIAHDGSEANVKDGSEFGERDGAISFVPPSDWAACTVDSSHGYWVKAGIATGKAANMTTVGLLNATEHDIITPTEGWVATMAGSIVGVRIVDGAGTLHTTADVKFILMNYTTGAHSGELTFAQDKRAENLTISGGLAIADGDILGVLCTQEDGSAEPSGVLLELEIAAADA
jgi:hypothetical protein